MKTLVLLSLLLSTMCQGWAQPPVSWQRVINPRNIFQIATAIEQIADGGFIIGAYTLHVPHHLSALRLDAWGDTLWTRDYGSCFSDYDAKGLIHVHQQTNGDFTFVGNGWNAAHQIFEPCVIRANELGEPTSTLYYGGAERHAQGACSMPDGGIVLAGTYDWDHSYLQRISPAGDSMWTYICDAPYENGLHFVVPTEDGGLFATGYTVPEAPNIHVVRTNANGMELWSRTYDYPGFQRGWTCAAMADGGFTIGGEALSGQAMRFFLMRISSSGDTLWTCIYRQDWRGKVYAVAATPDGGLIAAGSLQSQQGGRVHSYIVRTNASGDPLWEILDDANVNSTWEVVTRLDDGGYGVAGSYDHWPRVLSTCAESSSSGRLTLVQEFPHLGCFRLHHEAGVVSRLVFANTAPGANGSISGDAVGSWTAVSNGDGNNGDSVIFEATIPLAIDSIDTFYVSHADNECLMHWVVECRLDTVHVWNGTDTDLVFRGENYGFGTEIRITIEVPNEWNVGVYDVLGYTWSGEYELLASFPATNDSSYHTYVYRDLNYGHTRYLLRVTDSGGCSKALYDRELVVGQNVPIAEPPSDIPRSFELAAYPNPFNPTTDIRLKVPRQARTVVTVHDLLGRHVATLYDGMLEPGEHRFEFDGSNLPSGIYFARVQAGEFVKTQKLLLLK